MTPQEAIAEIKWVKEQSFINDVSFATRIIDALEMAVMALEKQIPKSPCTAMSNADFFGNTP